MPATETAAPTPSGLAGVIAADTAIGDVRGREGFYHYRQYDATELARHRTVEHVWALLLTGELPALGDDAFAAAVRSQRTLPAAIVDLLPQIAAGSTHAAPLAALRTAVSATAAELGLRPVHDLKGDEVADEAIALAARVPALVAALWRLGNGQAPAAADPAAGIAAGYLQMLHGAAADPDAAMAVERYLVTTIDHGFNASTFAARVVASTGADAGAAIVAGLGALSGPLHGGAPARALDMLDAIGTADAAEAWVRQAVSRGERIMGFGHRVYRTQDPRAALLKETALGLGGDRVELAVAVEDIVQRVLAELKPGRELYANVEFYAAVLLDRAGIPRELFTPTFAISRAIGWTAHIVEQHAEGRLIRPSARYVGPPPPVPVPA